MDKKFADEMIKKFQDKFFGFALAKMANISEAEELASRITCEAYVTLRKVDNIYNWEGYMYKIASNVYAKYINEQVGNRTTSIDDGLEVGIESDMVQDIERREELQALKKELAWLCKTHRQIIVMHYYHNKKISQIAEELGLPQGTVKWHLSDAKKLMKEGITNMRTANVAFEPIEFAGVGHDGCPGNMGDTATFLNSRLRKNIVYVTYREARTIEQIAEVMGITPVYIEDEVAYLEEYGFLEKLPGNKYLSQVYISEIPEEAEKKCFEIDMEVAKVFAKEYVPLLIEQFKDYKEHQITVPEDDYNYFLWSLIPYAISALQMDYRDVEKAKAREKYMIKRKDGGEYIAHACVYVKKKDNTDNAHLWVCGDMTRQSSQGSIKSWSLSTNIDTREKGWEDNRDSDYTTLQLYLQDKLPKTEAVVEKYARLYDRGFLYNNHGEDELNVISVKVTGRHPDTYSVWDNQIRDMLPKLPDSLLELLKKKSDEKYELLKVYYPKRMHELLSAYEQIRLNQVMVLDALLEQKQLKPLSERQKKGVFQMIFEEER